MDVITYIPGHYLDYCPYVPVTTISVDKAHLNLTEIQWDFFQYPDDLISYKKYFVIISANISKCGILRKIIIV